MQLWLLPHNPNGLLPLPPIPTLSLDALGYLFVEHFPPAERYLGRHGIRPVMEKMEAKSVDQARLALLDVTATPVGVMSDVGYPCLADPGAYYVAAARQLGWQVHCWIGFQSFLHALALSGWYAQQWHFLGYPPKNATALQHCLATQRRAQSRLIGWIEAPHRNNHFRTLLAPLLRKDDCYFCAQGLLSTQEHVTYDPQDPLAKVPTIFLCRLGDG